MRNLTCTFTSFYSTWCLVSTPDARPSPSAKPRPERAAPSQSSATPPCPLSAQTGPLLPVTWEHHLLSLNLKKTASSGSKPFKQMFPLGVSLPRLPPGLPRAALLGSTRRWGGIAMLFRKGEENIF